MQLGCGWDATHMARQVRSSLAGVGREVRSRKRLEPNSPRRVGPQRVPGVGLRAEVEVPAARKAGPRGSRGSSPALVLQLPANDLGDD